MAIEKSTVVDQVTIDRNGNISVRLGLLIVEDGVELAKQCHRFPVDADVDESVANVNAHLEHMKAAVIDAAGIEVIRAAKSFRDGSMPQPVKPDQATVQGPGGPVMEG